MSREIKFRAWDTESKCFFIPTYEAYAGKLEDLSIDFSGRLLRRTLEMPAEDESRFKGQYILSQYTGLKDRNGKEIYEGDLLNGSEVYWSPQWAMFTLRGDNVGALVRFADIYEINGNIYEQGDDHTFQQSISK